ncbi:MAG: hypothetical protein JO002_15960, partial [Burkholderiaceae bacterium]|nr:hypothetical protein [Burkholderiaceae bacterium]
MTIRFHVVLAPRGALAPAALGAPLAAAFDAADFRGLAVGFASGDLAGL